VRAVFLDTERLDAIWAVDLPRAKLESTSRSRPLSTDARAAPPEPLARGGCSVTAASPARSGDPDEMEVPTAGGAGRRGAGSAATGGTMWTGG
jgi:hypothetical protein